LLIAETNRLGLGLIGQNPTFPAALPSMAQPSIDQEAGDEFMLTPHIHPSVSAEVFLEIKFPAACQRWGNHTLHHWHLCMRHGAKTLPIALMVHPIQVQVCSKPCLQPIWMMILPLVPMTSQPWKISMQACQVLVSSVMHFATA